MNKAQASMEYLLVAGLIILVILPSIYIFYSYSHRSNVEISQSQLNKVGRGIVDAAEEVYYLGEPSKTTLELTMPEGVIGMEIWRNQELVFFLNDGSEIAFKSRVNITSNMICMERCYYNFTKRFYSPGIKNIVVKAEGDHVLITLKEEENKECITEICNGLDDDCDGEIDEDWPELGTICYEGVGACRNSGEYVCTIDGTGIECNAIPGEPTPEMCNDHIDNDCDGKVDCSDIDCAHHPICQECVPEICNDGKDNDCDGLVDCDDPDCYALISISKPADSVLVTDTSGSMNDCAEYGSSGCLNTKMDLAKQADLEFVDFVLKLGTICYEGVGACRKSGKYVYTDGTGIECNAIPGEPTPEICNDYIDNDCDGRVDCSDIDCIHTHVCVEAFPTYVKAFPICVPEICNDGKDNDCDGLVDSDDPDCYALISNQIGTVSYASSVGSVEPLTDSKITLQNEINGYYAGGGTCICCGINRAKDMLLSSSNEKFMVVMSDGAATMYCDNFNDYTGSGTGWTSDPIDTQWAINAGQNACNQNITVFTVGFGEDADHETLKQIACDESLYYDASNVLDITEIYQEIGKQTFIKRCKDWYILYRPGDPCPPGMACMD